MTWMSTGSVIASGWMANLRISPIVIKKTLTPIPIAMTSAGRSNAVLFTYPSGSSATRRGIYETGL
ncbi:hypothetical protein GCM10009735_23940 [Actinomadura chokoriensis]